MTLCLAKPWEARCDIMLCRLSEKGGLAWWIRNVQSFSGDLGVVKKEQDDLEGMHG